MFFFGWGKRNVTKVLSQNETLVLNYGYFDVFFAFSIAFNYHYTLATLSEKGWYHKAITKQEAAVLLKGEKFEPHWWRRYSLFVFIIMVILLILLSSIFSRS